MSEKTNWISRLKNGLSRSTSKLSEGLSSLLTKRRLDNDVLEELEELLVASDIGPVTAAKLVAEFSRTRFGKDVSDEEVRQVLAAQMAEILLPCAKQLVIDKDKKPFVVLMIGVNGAGKTTTIGKMAKRSVETGRSVMIVAGDTFRAAAVSQLQTWGERAQCPVITGPQNSDSAALAYQAYERARAEKTDLLLIDTAGRLQNKTDLMQELSKISRVLKKIDPEAPHATILVLDATTGQNAHAQVEVFSDMINVTGLILTKLDGSAKGGVVVALADRFKLPLYAIGVGEGIDDLQPFNADDFARSLMGLEPNSTAD